MAKDEEPRIWVTVLKLVLGATVLIGGTGLALYYADEMQQNEKSTSTTTPHKPSWGIATDSPLRIAR